jgi:hypothetical protein
MYTHYDRKMHMGRREPAVLFSLFNRHIPLSQVTAHQDGLDSVPVGLHRSNQSRDHDLQYRTTQLLKLVVRPLHVSLSLHGIFHESSDKVLPCITPQRVHRVITLNVVTWNPTLPSGHSVLSCNLAIIDTKAVISGIVSDMPRNSAI